MLAADAALRADYERVTTLYAQLEPLQRVFGTANDYPALLGRALEAGRITLFEYLTEYNIYLDGAADYASLRPTMPQLRHACNATSCSAT